MEHSKVRRFVTRWVRRGAKHGLRVVLQWLNQIIVVACTFYVSNAVLVFPVDLVASIGVVQRQRAKILRCWVSRL